MSSNNVIAFPVEYSGPRVKGLSFKDIEDNVNMMKMFHIQETIFNLAPIIFNHLEISGFEMEENEEGSFEIRDGALMMEAIKSILCKHYDIYHPFQQLSEHIFEEDDEEDSLRIVENLNIVMKPHEE